MTFCVVCLLFKMCNWYATTKCNSWGQRKGAGFPDSLITSIFPRSGSIKPPSVLHGKYPAQSLAPKRCLINATNSHSPKSYLEAPGSTFLSVNSTRGRKSIFLWTAHYHLLMVHFEHITWTLIVNFLSSSMEVSNLCPAYLPETL